MSVYVLEREWEKENEYFGGCVFKLKIGGKEVDLKEKRFPKQYDIFWPFAFDTWDRIKMAFFAVQKNRRKNAHFSLVLVCIKFY